MAQGNSMKIGSTTSYPTYDYGVSAASQGKRRDATGAAAKPFADTVDISDAARAMQNRSSGIEPISPDASGSINTLAFDSTEGSLAGARAKGLRKYMTGSGGQNLSAKNANRKALGSRIDNVIKGLGIKLGKDEKLTISVDSNNKIVVGGIKDKDRAEKIQNALNKDTSIGRALRKHVADAKIDEYAKKQEDYEKQMRELGVSPADMGEDTDDLFTSRGMRSLIIDEYLQENAGIGLSALSLEKGADGKVSILGMNSQMNSLITDDKELGETIANILENGETSAEFKVSFEFANGTISDSSTDTAARDKIEGIKARLMGGYDSEQGQFIPGIIDQFRAQLEEVGGEYDEKFMQFLSRGFSIRVSAAGDFEILGADGLSGSLLDTLKGLVRKALSTWGDEHPNENADFIDVAEAFIEQHRFEHGDVDEFEHMVEIDFAGGRNAVKVVSPEADKAQDAANQQVADQLGEKLGAMLAENGVNTEGLEFSIDDSGKITVLGDPENTEVKKAQSIIDQFVQNAQNQGKAVAAGDPDEKEEQDRESRAIRRGTDDGDEGHVPEGYAKRDVEATGDHVAAEKQWKDFVDAQTEKIREHLPDPELKSAESQRIRDIYVGWQRNLPKTTSEAHYLSGVSRVSDVKPRRFAAIGGEQANGVGLPGIGGQTAGRLYSDDAVGLYLELMDGMGQFHDGRRDVSYKFSAA